MQISRIRLSDKTSRLHPRHVATKCAQACEPEVPIKVREWISPALASPDLDPLDISKAESGGPFRPMKPAPGLLGQVLCRLFFDPNEQMVPVAIDQPLTDGEILPIAGGIEVIHTPGHCAGHVALLWHPGRMLFAGDVCTNLMGLGDPVGFENLEQARASQRKLASLSFDAVGFGHGKPIARDASAQFRYKWGQKLAA